MSDIVMRDDREIEKCVSDIISNLMLYRLDIKNIGLENNAVEIMNTDGIISEPKWFTDGKGIGKVLQNNKKYDIIIVKVINDGKLRINFRGPYKKFGEECLKIWIDYKSIMINGKLLSSIPIATCHDKPYIYETSVKNGEEIAIEIEQQYHQYTEDELKYIIGKLYSNDEYIKENISEIVVKILKNNGGCSMKQINEYPQIKSDCFIPIGTACRPAHWLRNYHLRYCSLPFDWMMGCSLNFIMKSIKYGISDWFNEYTVDPSKAYKKCHYVYDTKNKFKSPHVFPLDKTVEEYMPEFKEVFGRRYERLIKLISQSDSVCFICNDRLNEIYDFYLYIKELKKIYPNKNYRVLHVRHSDELKSIKEYRFEDNITIYEINAYDINKNGKDKSNAKAFTGNEDLWGEICSNLSLSEEVKKRIEEENKNKDSVA